MTNLLKTMDKSQISKKRLDMKKKSMEQDDLLYFVEPEVSLRGIPIKMIDQDSFILDNNNIIIKSLESIYDSLGDINMSKFEFIFKYYIHILEDTSNEKITIDSIPEGLSLKEEFLYDANAISESKAKEISLSGGVKLTEFYTENKNPKFEGAVIGDIKGNFEKMDLEDCIMKNCMYPEIITEEKCNKLMEAAIQGYRDGNKKITKKNK